MPTPPDGNREPTTGGNRKPTSAGNLESNSGDHEPLKPEAPALIKNIAWLIQYGKRYWRLVALALLVTILSLFGKAILSSMSVARDPLTVEEFWNNARDKTTGGTDQ